MCFTYVSAGQPGAYHDKCVVSCYGGGSQTFPHPPQGKYYVVDVGFPNRERYHLPEWHRGTMVLHNFIRAHSSGDVDFANCGRDPDFVPTIPDRYNKYAVSSHASDQPTSEANFITMDTFRDRVATSLSIAWN